MMSGGARLLKDRTMKVGLIDVDGHNFPNLALMKLSAWHKEHGDSVEMAFPMSRYDRVYASKVFDDTYSRDINWIPQTDDFRKGGTGYGLDNQLPDEIEHMMPDYGLYGDYGTAYGFLTRGCHRGCPFCIVSKKEGRESHKVADLSEWWNGQTNIVLMDANILACKDCVDLLCQLCETRAMVDFNQGLDIRLMDETKARIISKTNVKNLHFAWDGHDNLAPMFAEYRPFFKRVISRHRACVFVLVGYNSDMDWNLHRIYTLRDLGYDPYVMVYNKPNAPHELKQLQRWCNNKIVFGKCKTFKEYKVM